MKKTQRGRRVADVIRSTLSSVLLSVPLEPSPGMVSITDCRMSRDLKIANVYYSVFGQADGWERAEEAFSRAGGRLRHELAHRTSLRYTPELRFHADHTMENAAHLDQLIEDGRRELPDDEVDGDDGDDSSA